MVSRRSLLAGAFSSALILGSSDAYAQFVASGAPIFPLTITDFNSGAIFQRNAGTNTSWYDGTHATTFTGGYSSVAPAGINITVSGITYAGTSFSVDTGAHTWTCKAAIPNGDGYLATATDTAYPRRQATQLNTWGVGILIGCIGQSNMTNVFAAFGASAVTADPHCRTTSNGTTWTATTYDGAGTWGNQIRAAMVAQIPGNTTPIGFLGAGVGGTSITSWVPTPYLTSYLNLITTCGGDVEFTYWHQGESDDNSGGTSPALITAGSPTLTGWQAMLQYIVAQLQAKVAAATPSRSTSQFHFGVAILGNDSEQIGTSGAYLDLLHTYQLAVAAQTGCFLAATLSDVMHPYGSQQHYMAFANAWSTYPRFGHRYAISTLNQLGVSGYAYGADGSKITGASWSVGSNQLVLTVTQLSGGTALKTGGGATSGTLASIYPFYVTSTGGQVISSAFFSGNTITLTMSTIRGSGDVVGFAYSADIDPYNEGDGSNTYWNNILFDNQQAYLGDPGDYNYVAQGLGGPSGFPIQPTSGGKANPMNVT